MAASARSLARRLLSLVTPDRGHPVVSTPPAISQEELERVHRFFPRPKFFILGYPRSGTTLLARLVRLHPEVHCNWQAHFVTRPEGLVPAMLRSELPAWLARRSNRWTAQDPVLAPALRALCDYVMERQAEAEGKAIVGDKSPSGTFPEAVIWLHRLYPDASLIYIVRDGRDVAVSRRVQQFIDYPDGLDVRDRRIRDSLRRMGEAYLEAGRSIFVEDWLQKEADQWRRIVQANHGGGEALYGERYLALRYEDLLEAPVEWMERVWDLLEAGPFEGADAAIRQEMESNPAAAWHESRDPALTRALPRGVAGGWRAVFNERDRALFEAIARSTLEAWGYDVNH